MNIEACWQLHTDQTQKWRKITDTEWAALQQRYARGPTHPREYYWVFQDGGPAEVGWFGEDMYGYTLCLLAELNQQSEA